MAAGPGLEPGLPRPERGVLPLDDPAVVIQEHSEKKETSILLLSPKQVLFYHTTTYPQIQPLTVKFKCYIMTEENKKC